MSTSDYGRVAAGAACVCTFVLVITVALSSTFPLQVAHAFQASNAPHTLHRPDLVCRQCHEAIYDAYQRTPMGKASGYAVDGLTSVELGAGDLKHGQSGVTYHLSIRDGQAFLAYNRSQSASHAALHGQDQLSYFIGSGKRGRTYLYQRDNLWFEAPINWYGKKQLWDMAPAYENSETMPSPLPVDANCLHCHTGEVQSAIGGARNRFDGAPFRTSGVGCAACHGDPTLHLAKMAQHKPSSDSILNPDKLNATRRDSVCLQCHLEGDGTVYLPGKSLAEFKAGDSLSDFAIYFVDINRAQQGGRATSQFEALLRSACKRASGDKLTCTTCHDPHKSPEPAERVAFFRAKCLTCHTGTAMATQHHPEQQDCANCHMPTRKTLDISHEQLTDHDIEARTINLKTLGASVRSPELAPVGNAHASDREEGLAYAQLAQRGERNAGEHALQLLQKAANAGDDDAELHEQLGFLLQRAGDFNGALKEYSAALRRNFLDTTAAANLAVLDAGKGRVGEAIRLLQQVVAEDPAQTAAGLNLAFLECKSGRKAEAEDVVRKMLTFNPDSNAAHTFLETGSYGGQTCLLH